MEFTGEHMCGSHFFIEREAVTWVFSCGFRGIVGAVFFIEHLG